MIDGLFQNLGQWYDVVLVVAIDTYQSNFRAEARHEPHLLKQGLPRAAECPLLLAQRDGK